MEILNDEEKVSDLSCPITVITILPGLLGPKGGCAGGVLASPSSMGYVGYDDAYGG